MTITSSEYGFPIFISSTDYNLIDLRAELAKYLSELGYRPILSSSDGFHDNSPILEPWESCLQVLRSAYVMVLVIDGKYGEPFEWKNFDSIIGGRKVSPTHAEYIFAHKTKMRMLVFIRKELLIYYQTYREVLKNYDGDKVKAKETLAISLPKHIAFKTLEFIEEVKTSGPIPWIKAFDNVTDIKQEVQRKMLNELAEIFLFKNQHLEAVVRAFSTVLDDLPADKRKETLEKIGATKEFTAEIESQTKVILDLKKEKDKLQVQLKAKEEELSRERVGKVDKTSTKEKGVKKLKEQLEGIDTKITTYEIKNANYLISGSTTPLFNIEGDILASPISNFGWSNSAFLGGANAHPFSNVLSVNPTDSKAPYYLGNLCYDKRQYPEAVACWEKSAEIDDTFPTVLRNLSLAYFNKLNKEQKAIEMLEKAFALDTTDARIFMELDQLYKRICRSHVERLDFLEKHFELVEQRDDVYLEYATLCNQIGNYNKAKELIDKRKFHPWEGGEGKVPTQYQLCRVELAKEYINKKDYTGAIELLCECLEYPYNLGEGKLYGAQENDFHYWLGCAYEGMGIVEEARKYWNFAKEGNTEPAAAIFYNDQKPDKIFYQGLALLKLGCKEEASSRFNNLINFGEKHLDEQIKLDYFAVSLPDLLIWEDDLTYRNKIHCHYMIGLGHLGLGEIEMAKSHLMMAFEMDINHQGVQIHTKLAVSKEITETYTLKLDKVI